MYNACRFQMEYANNRLLDVHSCRIELVVQMLFYRYRWSTVLGAGVVVAIVEKLFSNFYPIWRHDFGWGHALQSLCWDHFSELRIRKMDRPVICKEFQFFTILKRWWKFFTHKLSVRNKWEFSRMYFIWAFGHFAICFRPMTKTFNFLLAKCLTTLASWKQTAYINVCHSSIETKIYQIRLHQRVACMLRIRYIQSINNTIVRFCSIDKCDERLQFMRGGFAKNVVSNQNLIQKVAA